MVVEHLVRGQEGSGSHPVVSAIYHSVNQTLTAISKLARI